MYSDYFLKFSSKEEALQVFFTIPEHTYTPHNPETNEPLDTLEAPAQIAVCTQTETFAIDEVGILYENNGVYSEDGEVTTPPTQIPGYHYNYRTVYINKPQTPLPPQLKPYLVTPQTPQRTFF